MTEGSEVWAVVETAAGRLDELAPRVASEASRVAKLLGSPAAVAVVGAPDDVSGAAAAMGQYGVRALHVLDLPAAGPASPEVAAHAVAAAVAGREPRAVVLAATRSGSDLAARVAARLRRGLAAGVVEFELAGGALVARRNVQGGRAHATVTWPAGGPYLATVDLASLEAVADPAAGEVAVTRLEPPPLEATLQPVRQWRLPPRELDVAEADFVIGIGRPVAGPAQLERIQELADRLGAALGGSRISFFQGTIPKSRQIGASGKWIAPKVYLTLGISGASYHLMGIKGVKHLVAVNTDGHAPILEIAELGLVNDLDEVVEALLALVPAPVEARAVTA